MNEGRYQQASARAGANIALIKYWGKRGPAELNLPATGSISITLDNLLTTTRVVPDVALDDDRFTLNGVVSDDARIKGFLHQLRQQSAQVLPFCHVYSDNDFPTAAGLASSASGFAALVVALNQALNLQWSFKSQAIWARIGSGSAPRSLVDGFCRMHRGRAEDGHDAIPEGLLAHSAWPLEVVVAITDTTAKAISSRQGMRQTMDTSPYYKAWVDHNEQALDAAEKAILARDFETLALLSEASALQMHASAMASTPGVLYWRAASVECLHAIRALRAQGLGVFFTMDAGPQVKAICLPGHGEAVADALKNIAGVESVVMSALGPGARLL